MEVEDLGAIAFTSADYFEFVTNLELDVLTWERPIAVILPREGEPFALLHELSSARVVAARDRGTFWLEDLEVYAEHPRITNRVALLPDWPQTLAKLIAAHGLARGRIGVDALSRPVARALDGLPDLEPVALDQALRATRMVKTAEELDLMRQAAALSDWTQEQYRVGIRAGRLVEELDWSVGAAFADRAAVAHPGDAVQVRLLSFAGPASVAPHGTGTRTGQVIEPGWPMVNIIIIRLNGVTIENERTWFCSEPTDVQRRAFQAAVDAQDAAIAELRTGRPVAAFDAAALRVFVEAGLDEYVVHRTGHGVGLGHGGALTAHDFPDATAFETRPLVDDEVYSAEPGVYLPGVGGFRHDDTVIVGREPEVITHAPRGIEAQTVG
jgi:Xaa-Pro aminopeptidase